MKAEDLKRWLAVGAGGDTVRLVPVEPPSTGPDVFVKLQDANAAIAAAVATERERNAVLVAAMDADYLRTSPCRKALERAAKAIRKGPTVNVQP